jgi:hypothetical protein
MATFLMTSPRFGGDFFLWLAVLLAAQFRARTRQRRQHRASVCLVGGAPSRCSCPQQSIGPGHSLCPTREAGTNFTRYPSLHPVVPVRPFFSAQAPTNCGNINPSTSPRQTLRRRCPTLGVSSPDLGRRQPLAALFLPVIGCFPLLSRT